LGKVGVRWMKVGATLGKVGARWMKVEATLGKERVYSIDQVKRI